MRLVAKITYFRAEGDSLHFRLGVRPFRTKFELLLVETEKASFMQARHFLLVLFNTILII